MPESKIAAQREMFRVQFGLVGTLWQQYWESMRNLLTFNFGPSFSSYPTEVSFLIGRAMPYTIGLLLGTSLISWVLGNAIGLFVGLNPRKWYSKTLETVSMCVYPTPYFIMALILLILFCYLNSFFPLTADLPNYFSFTPYYFKKLFNSFFLPASSMIVLGCGWWIISMKSLSNSTSEEDFVHYARLKGLKNRTISYSYVFKNCILSQVTALALQLGGIFCGAMMVEVMFGIPGIGGLLQMAVVQSDYNLMLSIITISIVAVATATLIVDLIYPLLDPRIRYS
ncbi:MAG: ABC transporter permease [Eubacteriales bacterium]|nr:ABC transporter permease [Eubacteriales bacterium]